MEIKTLIMGTFSGPLIVEKLDDGKNWRVVQSFSYVTSCGIHVVIPEGFITDFASIPRGLWNIFPPTGKYGKAAVVHDYLYRETCVERDRADEIFLEAMEELGVNWLSRRVIYRAVRLFGGFARDNDNCEIDVDKNQKM